MLLRYRDRITCVLPVDEILGSELPVSKFVQLGGSDGHLQVKSSGVQRQKSVSRSGQSGDDWVTGAAR